MTNLTTNSFQICYFVINKTQPRNTDFALNVWIKFPQLNVQKFKVYKNDEETKMF